MRDLSDLLPGLASELIDTSLGRVFVRTGGKGPPLLLLHGYPYGDVVIALSVVLRIARTLDCVEIDKLIVDVQARKAPAIEHHRRADWRKRELSANVFEAACYHPNAASPSHFAPDRLG